MITTAIYAIAMFCVLIFMHELGHFIAARACHVKVNKFAIGMGPAFWKKQKGETEYSLRIFPIGGFCAMEGEDEDSDEPRALNNKKAWQKAIVICAGSFMNLLLAVVLMIIFVFYIGTATTTLDAVQKGSPAEEAGLKPGDKIVMVDGNKTNEWTDVTDIIIGTENNKAEITVERNGKEYTFVTGFMKNEEGRKMIGITSARQRDPVSAVKDGAKATFDMTVNMYEILKRLFTGDVSAKELSGPVGIVYMVDQSISYGFMYFLYFMSLISLNLAIVNMLPLPALDGGRLLFIIVRKITGKAITDDMEGKIHFIGIMLLLLLMVYVTWNDIVRFIVPIFN